MSDRLEKYIKSHKDELDLKEPRPDLWLDIANDIDKVESKKRNVRSLTIWRVAAAILLLVSSWLVFDKFTGSDGIPTEYVVTNQQLIEAEAFYLSVINNEMDEVMTMSEKYGLGEDFENDLNALDSMYSVLRQDLKNGNEENLVDAMILNLQLRIEVLSKQKSIISSIEKSKTENIGEDETIRL